MEPLSVLRNLLAIFLPLTLIACQTSSGPARSLTPVSGFAAPVSSGQLLSDPRLARQTPLALQARQQVAENRGAGLAGSSTRTVTLAGRETSNGSRSRFSRWPTIRRGSGFRGGRSSGGIGRRYVVPPRDLGPLPKRSGSTQSQRHSLFPSNRPVDP